ncbi:ABC transporter G family member 1-like isoform X2 [Apium graveolens]|uniref:ABC transporter G family member 1-like isoform X2 n=1 Tax=Apium graveolens TaxID=4045 RepID=UPI003D7A176E
MDSTVKIPIWTPAVNPTRTLLLEFMSDEKHAEEGNIAPPPHQDHVYYNPYPNNDTSNLNNFPYTSAASAISVPQVPQITNASRHEAPSLRQDDHKKSCKHRSASRVSDIERVQSADRDEGARIYITWKDVWVTVPSKKGGRRPILQGLTGYVEPGQSLAIMGPSGCGKSTLLDTLAGRLGSNTKQSGDILINGRKQTLAFGTSAYVTQDDSLMTTLTVREAVYFSAQLQLPDSMPLAEKRERAETTIIDMGLQNAMNTRIGGWTVKGLSGGQKRRVSICIEILTRPSLLFLDEPTSGLDSAASYHVMSRIITLARQDKRTIIASIHQPSAEVFELFHNLCLLSSGRQVYFGPTGRANEFFTSNGFPCPPMRNPSDHFLRTINKDFDTEDEQTINGGQTATEAINVLVKAFQSSDQSHQVQNRVSEICHMNVGTVESKGSQASFFTQCIVLTKRSFLNMHRDLGYYWLRLIVYITLALCLGTLFRNVGHTYGSIQARGSMLMFIAAFLTFMAIGGFPSFVEDMKIFSRERLNGHYGVAAFVVANTFSSLPFLMLIGLIPGVISYYLVGLQKEFGHFVYYALLIFVCMILVESLMMVVASIVPDFLMGIISGAGIQGIMILNGGFFRLPDDMPKPFWKYPMYYISFHKYAFEGFYKNEYIGLTFPNEKAGGPRTITGDEILEDIWQVDNSYSKWVDMTILLLMVATYRILFFLIVKGAEKYKPMIREFLSNLSIKQTTYSEDSLHQQESSVRTVRAFSVLDCKCYKVDVTIRD